MQKRMPRGEIRRYEEAREVLPEYPWRGKFETREQVDRYLGTAEITCLLCGKTYKCLAPHVKRIHKVSAEDYKEFFGLPNGRGIDCAETTKNRSDASKMNGAIRFVSTSAARMNAMRNKPKRQRKLPNFVRKESADRFRECARNQDRATDFSWHFEKLSTVWRYVKEKPPAGFVSWSQFKKRWLKDPELKRQMLDSRSKFGGKLAERRSKNVQAIE